MAKLTAKQEGFAREYVSNGGDASAAYRKAYNAENMTPKSVNENASKLLKHNKVAPRVKELQSKVEKVAEEKFTVSIEQRLRWLQEIVQAGMSEQTIIKGESAVNQRENLPAANKAIEILNSMLGTDDQGGKSKPVKVVIGVEDAS